jgi:hypothetical protein
MKTDIKSLGSSVLYPVPESIDMDAIPVKDDTFSPDDAVIHNPRDVPAGKYFLFDIENVEWCCDKMRSKQGTTDTFVTLDHIEGEGLSKRWYGKCPYCKTPLVITVSGFCIDKDSR